MCWGVWGEKVRMGKSVWGDENDMTAINVSAHYVAFVNYEAKD